MARRDPEEAVLAVGGTRPSSERISVYMLASFRAVEKVSLEAGQAGQDN